MCLIISTRTDKKIDKETITDAWFANSEGAGFAYRRKNKIKVEKGFMELEHLLEAYARVNSFPHVMHFRIETSGGVQPLLTHPFPCDGSENTTRFLAHSVLFQNGICSDYEMVLFSIASMLGKEKFNEILSNPMSDTLVISKAVEVLGPNILKLLNSKWLYFTKDQMLLYGDWDKDDDFYYSNKFFGYSANTHWTYANSIQNAEDTFQKKWGEQL